MRNGMLYAGELLGGLVTVGISLFFTAAPLLALY